MLVVETHAFFIDRSVKVHQVDPSLDSAFMLQRANYLKDHQSDSIHVLVSNNTVMVAVNAKAVPGVTAQKVRYRLEFRLMNIATNLVLLGIEAIARDCER